MGRVINDEGGEPTIAWKLELRDLARALAGALFVSLPLLFTMEMWEIAKAIPAGVLLTFLLAAIVINRGFLLFSGFRHRNWVAGSDWWDAMVAVGIGAFASATTLALSGLIAAGTDIDITMRMIALETIPTSMGATVAMNQLSGGDSDRRGRALRRSTDLTVALGALLGGFLFAFNVAPTMETKVVASQQSWPLVAATFAASIGISFLVVHVAQFEGRDMAERRILTTPWLEALVAYAIAFALSWALLFVFQYIALDDPAATWLPQVVALAYATSLGGAAGRIVL